MMISRHEVSASTHAFQSNTQTHAPIHAQQTDLNHCAPSQNTCSTGSTPVQRSLDVMVVADNLCVCVCVRVCDAVAEEMTWRLRDHALSSCSEGITIADPSQPDAPLIYVNDAFLQITGYSREDVIGRNCRFLQGEETSREAVATLKAAVMAKRKATVELLNYKKTGTRLGTHTHTHTIDCRAQQELLDATRCYFRACQHAGGGYGSLKFCAHCACADLCFVS